MNNIPSQLTPHPTTHQSSELYPELKSSNIAPKQPLLEPQSSEFNSAPSQQAFQQKPPVSAQKQPNPLVQGSELNSAPVPIKSTTPAIPPGVKITPAQPVVKSDAELAAEAKNFIRTTPPVAPKQTFPLPASHVPKSISVVTPAATPSATPAPAKPVAQSAPKPTTQATPATTAKTASTAAFETPAEPALDLPDTKAVLESFKLDTTKTIAEIKKEKKARNAATEERIKVTPSSRKYGKVPKGSYLNRLKHFEFDCFTDGEAKKVLKILHDVKIKSSLQRTKDVKVRFTEAENDRLQLIADELKEEKSRIVRKLCFTGESNEAILGEYKEIKYQIEKLGSNLNQISRVLNTRKSGINEDEAKSIDLSIKELRIMMLALDARLAR